MTKRLDLLLAERGLTKSRQAAKARIAAGDVRVNGKQVGKPSFLAEEDAEIILTGEAPRYVGRGGLKLEKALDQFPISLEGLVCADIGASTGGFTDCMLQHGARKVFAVDVGHGQLDETLKSDSRVVNAEGVNIRNAPQDLFSEKPDFVSIDVSFLSLRLVLPKIQELLAGEGSLVALIKPQFEAGPENVGKNGIVRSQRVHERVVSEILFLASQLFTVCGIIPSPILGGDGNIEYLLYAKGHKNAAVQPPVIDSAQVVEKAFAKKQ